MADDPVLPALPEGCTCQVVCGGAHDGGPNMRFDANCPVHIQHAESVAVPSSYVDRLVLAIKLLYGAHNRVVFDTEEDMDLQIKVLAEAREILGWDPETMGRTDG